MSQNKKQKLDIIDGIREDILKELRTMFQIFLTQEIKIQFESLIEEKIETLLNEKFNKVFEKEFEKKINNYLEKNFNLEDIAKLNEGLERRLKDLIKENEDIKNRHIK